MKKLILTALLVLSFAACGNDSKPESKYMTTEKEKKEIIAKILEGDQKAKDKSNNAVKISFFITSLLFLTDKFVRSFLFVTDEFDRDSYQPFPFLLIKELAAASLSGLIF